MPATWAKVHSGLAGLLERFAAHPSAAAEGALQLLNEAVRWQQLTQDPALLAAPPESSERSAPLGLHCWLGPALAAWDAPLQRLLSGPASSAARLYLFVSGCFAGFAAVHLARSLRASGAEALGVTRCARLVLGSGRLVAEEAPAAVALSAANSAASESMLGLPCSLETILVAACDSATFSPHAELITAVESLAVHLAVMLLRSPSMAAVALGLSPERWPARFDSYQAAWLAGVLSTPALSPALLRQLEQADDASALRLVRQAATVLQYLPTACPKGGSPGALLDAHTAAARLLAIAVAAVAKRPGSAAHEAVHALLPVVPQLAAALQLGASRDVHAAACRCLHHWLASPPEERRRLMLPEQGGELPMLLSLLTVAMHRAVEAHDSLRNEPGMARALQGTCAAHWAAVQAAAAAAEAQVGLSPLLSGLGGSPDALFNSAAAGLHGHSLPFNTPEDFRLMGCASTLSCAAVAGPAAVAHCPELLGLKNGLLQEVVQSMMPWLQQAAADWREAALDPALLAQLPAAAEAAELLRLLRRLGADLQAWEAPLQRLLRRPSALLSSTGADPGQAAYLFLAGFNAALVALALTLRIGATPSDSSELSGCARLVMGSGRLVAQHAPAAKHLSGSPHLAGAWLCKCVTVQTAVMRAQIELARLVGALEVLAEQTATPEALVAWLRALTDALQSLPPSAPDAFLGLPPGLDSILAAVCSTEVFKSHSELLAADAALCGRLVGMLLRSLGMAMVALQLPPEHWPQEFSLSTPAQLAALLVSQAMRPALERQMQQGEDAAVLRMLRQAAAVLQQLPASHPPEEAGLPDALQQHASAAALLACRQYTRWFGMILDHIDEAPRLAAHLTASGTLAAILEGMPTEGPGSSNELQCELQGPAFRVFQWVQFAAASEPAARLSEAADRVGLDQAALDAAAQQLRVQLRTVLALAKREGGPPTSEVHAALMHALPAAAQVATALQAHWQVQDAAPERQQAAQLELAQAAAARTSCAHLACPNVSATGRRGKLCTGCPVARYCSRACSVAVWRAGHRAACRLLAAERKAEAEAAE
ncbi:hypothetical protein ABPG75_002826 [Micractinium tetrahymenae]